MDGLPRTRRCGRISGNKAGIDWDERRPAPNDVGLILFTSGTTGDPKGVMHTHNSVLSAALPWPDHLGLGHDSVIHMASTFGHLTGYMYGVCLPLLVGGSGAGSKMCGIGEEFARLIEEFGIEHTSGATPYACTTSSRRPRRQTVICRVSGTSAVWELRFRESSSTRPKSCSRTSTSSVVGGETECGLVTMTAPGDRRQGHEYRRSARARGHGRADGSSIPLGEPVAAGTEGKVQVRGPFLFVGYLKEPKLTDEAFDGDWLDTGDIAEMDAEGFIKIGGRSKDIIIRGGENIPVAYVENVMYEHPAVSQVAIVAVPHPRLQEIACAVVTLRSGHSFTMDELREFFASKGVTKHYWPETLQVLDEFPRTPSGKIQKFKLREEVVGRHDK